MSDLTFLHDWSWKAFEVSTEFHTSDHVWVEDRDGCIHIGIRPDTHARDLISIVNFQLGYELLRKANTRRKEDV